MKELFLNEEVPKQNQELLIHLDINSDVDNNTFSSLKRYVHPNSTDVYCYLCNGEYSAKPIYDFMGNGNAVYFDTDEYMEGDTRKILMKSSIYQGMKFLSQVMYLNRGFITNTNKHLISRISYQSVRLVLFEKALWFFKPAIML